MKIIIKIILFHFFITTQLRAQNKEEKKNLGQLNYEISSYRSIASAELNHTVSLSMKKNILHYSSGPLSLVGFEKYLMIRDSNVFHFRANHRWEYDIQDFYAEVTNKDELSVSSRIFRGGRITKPSNDKYIYILGIAQRFYFKNDVKFLVKIEREFSNLHPVYLSFILNKTDKEIDHTLGGMISSRRAKSLYYYMSYNKFVLGFAQEWNIDHGSNYRTRIWMGYKIKY